MQTTEILIFLVVILYAFVIYTDFKTTDQIKSINENASKTSQVAINRINSFEDRIKKIEFSANETFLKYATNKEEFTKIYSQLDMLRAQVESTREKQFELRNDLSLRKPIIKLITSEVKKNVKKEPKK